MKAIVGLLLLGMLSGCAMPEESVALSGEAAEFTEIDVYSYISILVDNRTGCHYIKSYKSGLQPRMYSDGTQVCD
jgi:hypothetical protein